MFRYLLRYPLSVNSDESLWCLMVTKYSAVDEVCKRENSHMLNPFIMFVEMGEAVTCWTYFQEHLVHLSHLL